MDDRVVESSLLFVKFLTQPDICITLCVRYYSREDTEDCVKYISGTILDDRPIRVDFDWGFQEGRQWGRGRSGGQVCYGACHLLLPVVCLCG